METLNPKKILKLYSACKEHNLYGKWIHYKHISQLLIDLENHLEVLTIGTSEKNIPIKSVKFGSGEKKILIWTQMHGNESTGTKAIFDLFNCFIKSTNTSLKIILKECTVLCIPMLNPDGALKYTRENVNNIDLNRDAVDRKAKESNILRSILESFDPDFCFNLHDQRTIFGVEGTKNPATISFLAPSEEKTRKLTQGRKETMNVIVAMNELLQQLIPNHVGRYTDEFYPTATGDNFQKIGYNTVLIEAGHYPNDYEREESRKYNFLALLQGIYHIAITDDFNDYKAYFNIPNNEKSFYDVIEKEEDKSIGKAFLYVDRIENEKLITAKELKIEGDISKFNAHFLKVNK